MKSLKIFMAILSVAVMFSCSKEQSSLDIYSIPTKATIKGTLCYDAGIDYVNGEYVQLIKPASGVKVVLSVSNSDLSPDGNAKGCTYFETISDGNGNYAFVIPVLENTDVTIKPCSFERDYISFDGVGEDGPEMKSETKLYTYTYKTSSSSSSSSKSQTVSPNDLIVEDFIYNYEGGNLNPDKDKCDYIAEFEIYVWEPYYEKVGTIDFKSVAMKFEEVAGKNVIITYGGKKYGAKSDSDGCAKFYIPVDDKAWTIAPSIITVEGYVYEDFEYHKVESEYGQYGEWIQEFKTYIMNGTMEYSQYNTTKTFTFSGIEGDEIPTHDVKMIFKPFDSYTSSETGNYDESEWRYVTIEKD